MNDYLLYSTLGRSSRSDVRPVMPGERDPDWLVHEVANRRALAEIQRDAKVARLMAPKQEREGLAARLRHAFGRA